MSAKTAARAITRRAALRGLGAVFAAVPLAQLWACEPGDESMDDVDMGGPDDAGSSSDAGVRADAAINGGLDAASADAAQASTGSAWATGGTAAMLARATYPNPFASASGTSCKLACDTTIGPCHTSSPERADVSDGWNGLPMRISLRVVDADCAPVAGALVEIWHTNYKGIYSGRISTMCNKDEVDRAAQYFRGFLRTDADGRVDFDSTFPGWYTSRAVHVHLRVLKGDYVAADDAEAWVVTQLLFDDSLIGSIFASEPLYSPQGQPDTLLSADNVVGGETDKSPYLFDVAKMSDGAMQASKTLVLRSSLDEASCGAAGGGGGMGGPPGGGMGDPPPGG